jgi:hypothetical protein
MPIAAASPHAPARSARSPFRRAPAAFVLTAAVVAAAACGTTATQPDTVAKTHVAPLVIK